jgi:hypothetical protein
MDGASYLAALKQASATQPGTAAGAASAANAQGSTAAGTADPQTYTGVEKRRSPRYKCEGSAELREAGHEIRTWVTFTDISMHGCYVEATATFPVGTKLHLKLETKGFQVLVEGEVRVSYPYLGMGIMFTAMSDENRSHLRDLLRAVSRPAMIMGPGIASSLPAAGAPEPMPAISDPASAMRVLVEYFEHRQMLMREEFLRIVRKSQAVEAKPGK